MAALTGKEDDGPRAPRAESDASGARPLGGRRPQRPERAHELRTAIEKLDVYPSSAPACDRALVAASYAGSVGHGQWSARSRATSDSPSRFCAWRRAAADHRAGVGAAVARLGPEQTRAAIGALPRLSFPWQTSFEALLHRCGVHAQAVARSADRLSQMLRPFDRDDVVAAALMHDIGKLLLARIWPDFAAATPVRHTPEELVARERRALGYDHATLGGLLMERWGCRHR